MSIRQGRMLSAMNLTHHSNSRMKLLDAKEFAYVIAPHLTRQRSREPRRATPRRLLLASVAMVLAGLTGCSLINDSGSGATDEDYAVNDGNPSPTPNTSEQAQQAAHDDDPDTYCSLDEVNEGGWRDVEDGQMGFAYLPVFVGPKSEVKDELRNESASSTYIPYSTDKILLTSTPLGSGSVEEDEITDVSVKQVTIGLRDGWQVKKCGPATTLKITPVGSKKIKYLGDDIWYTKYWTVWELSGDNFNPLPKDRNTAGFSADITVGGQTIHTMMSNNLTQLPGVFATPGSATRTPDPGMALVRYYYEHHVWK